MNLGCNKRQRGAVYIAVLGASMLVTVLGVSAILAVQMQRKASEIDHAATQASLLARTAIEWALLEIQRDTNWRTTFTHDTWRGPVTLGRGTYRFKLVDVADSDLQDNAVDSVDVIGEGVMGQAMRLERVRLAPVDFKGITAGQNLLSNSDFETNSAWWTYSNAAMTLTRSVLLSYTGAASLLVQNRTATTDGPQQEISSRLINGQVYDTSVWIKSGGGNDNAVIRLCINSTRSGIQNYEVPAGGKQITNTSWKQVSGTITPKWQGDLIAACWMVQTLNATGTFSIDDAFFAISATSTRSMHLVESSWQQNLP